MNSKTKTVIATLMIFACSKLDGLAADVVAFNVPVEFSTSKPGNLSVANHRYVSAGKSAVFDDCVRKLRDFSKNASAFYRIRIEYRTAASANQRILDRCTLDPR